MSTSRRAVPAGRMSEPGLSWGAFPLARVFPALLACTVDLRAGVLQKMGGVTGGGPWGCRGGPCVKGGPSAPREAGAAFQSAVVISHCQKVRARFTFSHALKQLCYEKFQTQAEVETTAPRSQDTCPPRSLLPRCCRGGLIWLLFLFLFLCCSISKQVPDIMAFHLSALQYVVKKKKICSFQTVACGRGPVGRRGLLRARVGSRAPGWGVGVPARLGRPGVTSSCVNWGRGKA